MSQASRSISSYFKPLSSPASSSPARPKLNGGPSIPSSPINGKQKVTTSTVQTSTITTDDGKTETTTDGAGKEVNSSPVSSSGRKRHMNEVMLKAIQDGLAEGEREAKKAKVVTAPIFQNLSPVKSLSLGKASSREELRDSLKSHPDKLALLELELDTMGEDWLIALQEEFVKPYFLTLKQFITAEQKTKKVFPPPQDIYSWSRLCPLKDVRVVIIGQDPYHDDNQAHGLAFSVRKGVRVPPSLRNIYKEMSEDVDGFKIPPHGDLSEWARHGVLLLNTSLTVRAHEAASHSNRGWETFTAAVLKVVTSRLVPRDEEHDHISAVADQKGPTGVEKGESKLNIQEKEGIKAFGKGVGGNGVVFMAWGAHAQKMCSGVDKNKHLILKSVHPSPLSAMRGFFGSKHFTKANAWLEERYGSEGGIDWKALGA